MSRSSGERPDLHKSARRPGRPVRPEAQRGRIALLEGARAVLAEKGIGGMTLREVAARAGVDPALAKYYFGNKAGLQVALLQEVTAALRQRIERITIGEGTLQERLRALILDYVAAIAADPYTPRLVLEQLMFPGKENFDWFARDYVRPSLAAMRPLLAEGVASGELREVDPFFLIASFAGACLFFPVAGPSLGRSFGVEELDEQMYEAFAEHLADLFLRGTGGPASECDAVPERDHPAT